MRDGVDLVAEAAAAARSPSTVRAAAAGSTRSGGRQDAPSGRPHLPIGERPQRRRVPEVEGGTTAEPHPVQLERRRAAGRGRRASPAAASGSPPPAPRRPGAPVRGAGGLRRARSRRRRSPPGSPATRRPLRVAEPTAVDRGRQRLDVGVTGERRVERLEASGGARSWRGARGPVAARSRPEPAAARQGLLERRQAHGPARCPATGTRIRRACVVLASAARSVVARGWEGENSAERSRSAAAAARLHGFGPGPPTAPGRRRPRRRAATGTLARCHARRSGSHYDGRWPRPGPRGRADGPRGRPPGRSPSGGAGDGNRARASTMANAPACSARSKFSGPRPSERRSPARADRDHRWDPPPPAAAAASVPPGGAVRAVQSTLCSIRVCSGIELVTAKPPASCVGLSEPGSSRRARGLPWDSAISWSTTRWIDSTGEVSTQELRVRLRLRAPRLLAAAGRRTVRRLAAWP